MARRRRPRVGPALRTVAGLLVLAGCTSPSGLVGFAAPPSAAPLSTVAAADPAPLSDPALGLRAGPVPVPLELLLPSVGVHAPVIGVGITPDDVMDAPTGPPGDAAWQQAFWYRGSAVPGEPSTAVIAGHATGPGGRPAVFAPLGRLAVGHRIVVRNTGDGLDVTFAVTETRTYRLEETETPAVLTLIYGSGPVAGTPPQPSPDGLSHLTLVTCAGTYRGGTHDHRLVVSATRV
jgi:hypothetical protein